MKLFAILTVVCSLWICQSQAAAEIRSTTILFRHGQRTPAYQMGSFKSPLAEEIGYGQLTKHGSWQLYSNGLFLRSRYLHLLPKNGYFNLNNMQIMSSVPERTIMSLQSFMAGFFPPPISDLTLPLFWQPFTHSIDYEAKFLHFEPNLCPKYGAIFNNLMNNPPPEIVALLAQEKPTLDDLSARFGIPLNSLWTIGLINDSIKTMLLLGETIPSWAMTAYETTLQKPH